MEPAKSLTYYRGIMINRLALITLLDYTDINDVPTEPTMVTL